jgi:acetyltransferase-like isoleucine patch superfamily enzyme
MKNKCENKNKELSFTYRLLRFIGLNYPEQEYGQVSMWDVVKRIFSTYRTGFLIKFGMNSWILSPISHRKIRPIILRKIGCKVGKDVFIGSNIWVDTGHANLITIEDHAHVDARCVLLCHKRNLSNYFVGDDYAKLPYKTEPIFIKRGCSIGTDSIIMPGVTIGEGAIVGAGSLVTKDIPAWTVAVGRPAKVVRYIPQRTEVNKEQ